MSRCYRKHRQNVNLRRAFCDIICGCAASNDGRSLFTADLFINAVRIRVLDPSRLERIVCQIESFFVGFLDPSTQWSPSGHGRPLQLCTELDTMERFGYPTHFKGNVAWRGPRWFTRWLIVHIFCSSVVNT